MVADGVIVIHETIDKFVSGELTGSIGRYLMSIMETKIKESDLRYNHFRYSNPGKKLQRQIFKYRNVFTEHYGYMPTPRQIALDIMSWRFDRGFNKYRYKKKIKQALDLLERNIILIFEINGWPVELNRQIGFEEGGKEVTLGDTISTDNLRSKSKNKYEYIELQDLIYTIFDLLDEEEKLIIGHYFGIWIGNLCYKKLKTKEIIPLLNNKDIQRTWLIARKTK